MDQQRHTQKKLGNGNIHTFPKLSTHLAIEVHGVQVYSHRVFEEFQEEVKYSIDTCKSRGFSECDSLEVTTVRDANRDKNYEVTYCPDTLKATCSCRMLERKGILCRWCKDAMRSKIFDCNGEATENVDIIDGKQIAMSVMWSEIHQTVGSPLNKQQQLEKILGCSASQEITILPPKQSKNKGSGKRVLSMKAKAVALARKPKRMCKNCKRLANHDKRNCPNPFVEHPPLSPLSESSSEEEEVEEEEVDILE
ncbi:uncharacterized protein LOC141618152 [Silene latifolia]|uniref:uncharacterized protein LOC141618152 n=1 Tax=Silene latifolia TaxID=37657 RepID=UPI003D7724C5